MTLQDLPEYLTVRVGFFEKDCTGPDKVLTDNQFIPFVTIEHHSNKEDQKVKKRILAEVLLNPHDFNFGELETYDLRYTLL